MHHEPDCDCICDLEEPKPNRVTEPDEDGRWRKHRWACDVLVEMREILGSRTKWHANPSDYTMMTLVEELQSMVTRMEAALEVRKSIREWEQEAKEIAAKVDLMQKEAYDMGLELDSQKHNALSLGEREDIDAELHRKGL